MITISFRSNNSMVFDLQTLLSVLLIQFPCRLTLESSLSDRRISKGDISDTLLIIRFTADNYSCAKCSMLMLRILRFAIAP